jgi:hypothetical protein
MFLKLTRSRKLLGLVHYWPPDGMESKIPTFPEGLVIVCRGNCSSTPVVLMENNAYCPKLELHQSLRGHSTCNDSLYG